MNFNSTWGNERLGSMQKVVPSSMRWDSPKESIAVDRKEVKLKALQGSYGSAINNIIRWYIPNSDFIDFRKAYIKFELVVTPGAGATYTRLSQGIWSLFDRLRIFSGFELEDVRYHNIIYSIMNELMADPITVNSAQRMMHGVGTQYERNQWSSSPKIYILPIFSGFLQSALIPMGKVDDRLEIELYISDLNYCFESDATSVPTVVINNPEIIYDRVIPEAEYTNRVITALNSGGLRFSFRTFEVYQNQITSQRTSNNINHRSSAVDSFLHIMRVDSNMGQMSVNDKFLNWGFNGAVTYQMKINNQLEPEEPIICGEGALQAYLTLLRWLTVWNCGGVFHNAPMITPAHWTTDRFIMVNDLNGMPDRGLINQRSTSRAASTIQLDLLLGTTPASSIRLDTIAVYFMVIKLSNGKFSRLY